MLKALHVTIGILGAGALMAACGATSGGGHSFSGTTGTGGTGGQGAIQTGGNTSGSGTGGDGFTISFNTGGGGSSGGACNVTDQNLDNDHDGWSIAEGDCNDCEPNVNPGAIDTQNATDGGTPTWGDEDCDGTKGSASTTPCDSGLAIESQNAQDAAKAVDLCQITTVAPANKKDKKWGVVSSKWVLPDGAPPPSNPHYHLGHGILKTFGPNVHVQGGNRMLVLSSGSARQPTDLDYNDVAGFSKGYTCNSPPGFPKESQACPGVITGKPHDGVALELQIRAPTNATGFTFDFNFFTYEWPAYVCSQFNDFFVALLSPIPAGQSDGNISFDKQNNPVSVNNAFVEVCGCSGGPPCMAGSKSFNCLLGDSGLIGTGFGKDTDIQDHASTGWLITKAPVTGGETITLRWTVYDSGDGVLDTTTLVDHWQWIANGTVTVGTDPIGTPQ